MTDTKRVWLFEEGNDAGRTGRLSVCQLKHPPHDRKKNSMPHPRFTNQEIAHKGEEIYTVRLRDILEKDSVGQVVIIDIETGEYEIGSDSLAANHLSKA